MPQPTAAFTGTPLSGSTPLTVQFTDASTSYPEGTITGWYWDFGDGSTSTQQNPAHTFTTSGYYTVKLRATNSYGETDWENKTAYVTAGTVPLLLAAFSGTPLSGELPYQDVHFTDSSTGSPFAWFWEFGDGFTSTQQNPTYRYVNAGLFTVNLTVTNLYGSNTTSKTNYVNITMPGGPETEPLPEDLKINAEVGEKYIRWEWPVGYLLDVYVDGKLKLENTTMNFYYLKDLKPNEEHRLDLMNVSSQDAVKTSVVKTTAPSGLIWITVIMGIALALLMIFLQGWPVILVGSVEMLCGWFGRSIAYGYFGVDILCIVFMIFSGVFIVKATYEIGRGEIAWY